MKTFYEFDSVPYEEECSQTGVTENYFELQKLEATALIEQLKRQFPQMPADTTFKMATCSHDFGDYIEVRYVFDDSNYEHVEFLGELEDNFPSEWDTEAKEFLKSKGYKL